MKFNRFANNGARRRHAADAGRCTAQMRDVIGQFCRMAYNEKYLGLCRPKKATAAPTRSRASPTPCSAITSSRRTTRIGNAPVNYPPVWNIWKFDWVQYNASVSQPMARNIGESMGTGAKYALLDRYGKPLPPEQRFRSSAIAREPAHASS